MTEDAISKQICAWLRANRIDPTELPADSQARLSGDQLTFLERVRDASGRLVIDQYKARTEPATVTITVPPTPFIKKWLDWGSPSPLRMVHILGR